MHRRALKVFAGVPSIHVQDELAAGDLSEAWTGDALKRRLATAPVGVGVQTAISGRVRVFAEVLSEPPLGRSNLATPSVDAPSSSPTGRSLSRPHGLLSGC